MKFKLNFQAETFEGIENNFNTVRNWLSPISTLPHFTAGPLYVQFTTHIINISYFKLKTVSKK
jgi:hypothetical protein